MGDEVDFLPADKHEGFLNYPKYQNAQITENNKFAISLQYLKKELSDRVDFLHVDKHESFLQIDSIMGLLKHS